MSRKAIEINKSDLEIVIENVVKDGAWKNTSVGFQKVAEKYKLRTGTKASWLCLKGRADKWNISYPAITGRKVAVAKEETKRLKEHSDAELFKKSSKDFIPNKYHNLINRTMSGSKTAAIKLKCLECTCWQPKEITSCDHSSCPLFLIRPYQKRGKSGEDI